MTHSSKDICAQCKHFKMKEYPQHAAVGIGRCTGYDGRIAPLDNPFLPWGTAACSRFSRDWQTRAAREQWIEKRRAKEQNNNEVQPETKG